MLGKIFGHLGNDFSPKNNTKAIKTGGSIGGKLILVVVLGAILNWFLLPAEPAFILAAVIAFAPNLLMSVVSGLFTVGFRVIGATLQAIWKVIEGLFRAGGEIIEQRKNRKHHAKR